MVDYVETYPEIPLSDYTPVVILGPEGSPNGSLAADPQAVVIAADGSVYVKTLGTDTEGWIQTYQGTA